MVSAGKLEGGCRVMISVVILAPTEHTSAKGAKKKKKTCHLFRSHANRLDAELAAAKVEEVFQVRAQEVDNENVVETLLTKMVNLRYTDCATSREKYMH